MVAAIRARPRHIGARCRFGRAEKAAFREMETIADKRCDGAGWRHASGFA